MKSKVKIEILKPLGRGLPAGKIVEVDADSGGTPLEQFWRRRLRDADRDDCCRVVGPKKRKKTTKEDKE